MGKFSVQRYLAELERAEALELAQMLRRPSSEETAVLQEHLGEEKFKRMRRMAQTTMARVEATKPKGNVVFIPGLCGSELTEFSPGGGQEPIWPNVRRLAADGLERLRFCEEASTNPHDEHIESTGVLKRYYGVLLLHLAARWDVRDFHYDWREDLEKVAEKLFSGLQDKKWILPGEPVHIVAHGTGGLIAWALRVRHPELWESTRRCGRLVFLGTPTRGTYIAVQALAGVAGFVKKLGLLKEIRDEIRDRDELLKVILSFPSFYQLLPSPSLGAKIEPLYKANTYTELKKVDVDVPQGNLDRARRFHESLGKLSKVEDAYTILGYGQPTFCGVEDVKKLDDLRGYAASYGGDGVVALDMAQLDWMSEDQRQENTILVAEEHAGLPSNPEVLAAIDELLTAGKIDQRGRARDRVRIADVIAAESEEVGAADEMTDGCADAVTASGKKNAWRLLTLQQNRDVCRTHELTRQVRLVGDDRGTGPSDRQVEEYLTRDLLSPGRVAARRLEKTPLPLNHPKVQLGIACTTVASMDYEKYGSQVAKLHVDAIAIGHYLGVKPTGGERELDEAISRAILNIAPGQELKESELVLTQYSERGILKGELGQPFFLPDPRDPTGKRILVIAGMGVPGRFGMPELTVLARELCWSVGRLNKRHLVIGSVGARFRSMALCEAVRGWIRGLKNAITGAIEEENRHIMRITILIEDPRQIEPSQAAILDEIRQLEDRRRLEIEFTPFDAHELEDFRQRGDLQDRDNLEKQLNRRQESRVRDRDSKLPATRVTLNLEGNSYRFGALTEDASVPERAVPLDPALVQEANALLATETDSDHQFTNGLFLSQLLIPAELREAMASPAPVVMILDALTSEIHWEMVARPDPVGHDLSAVSAPDLVDDPFDRKFEYSDSFLGTSRGFTRQLRTTLAPPPEPPPPLRRLLRVLVVANPAEDASLPGAEREGHEVADAFEAFNAVYEGRCDNRVEVLRLIGPAAATRTRVLAYLMMRRYDVLHFAGHCLFDKENPTLSGWVFHKDKGQRLSAYELTRVDRVPRFVFSNACESGVMATRIGTYSPGLAPSFAEAFFQRGVSNFVCTAWPVDDGAALEFALWVYYSLLGLRPHTEEGSKFTAAPPLPMHSAMRQARLQIAGQPHGVRTWGAYQHYGNPYYRFFDPESMKGPSPAVSSSSHSS